MALALAGPGWLWLAGCGCVWLALWLAVAGSGWPWLAGSGRLLANKRGKSSYAQQPSHSVGYALTPRLSADVMNIDYGCWHSISRSTLPGIMRCRTTLGKQTVCCMIACSYRLGTTFDVCLASLQEATSIVPLQLNAFTKTRYCTFGTHA